MLDSRDGAGGAGRDGWGAAGLCGAERVLSSCFGPAVPRRRISVAVSLIRKIGLSHCCGRKGLGGAERSEAVIEGRPGRCGAAGHVRLAWCDGEGQQRRGSVVRVGGWGGGQTWVGVWNLWMGRAGNSQGKEQQQGRLNSALFQPQQPSGEQPPGSRRSSHGGRNFDTAEISIYWS